MFLKKLLFSFLILTLKFENLSSSEFNPAVGLEINPLDLSYGKFKEIVKNFLFQKDLQQEYADYKNFSNKMKEDREKFLNDFKKKQEKEIEEYFNIEEEKSKLRENSIVKDIKNKNKIIEVEDKAIQTDLKNDIYKDIEVEKSIKDNSAMVEQVPKKVENKKLSNVITPLVGGTAVSWFFRNSDFHYADLLPDKWGKKKVTKFENYTGLTKLFNFGLGAGLTAGVRNVVKKGFKNFGKEQLGKTLAAGFLATLAYMNSDFFENTFSNIYARSNSYYWKAEKLINMYFESLKSLSDAKKIEILKSISKYAKKSMLEGIYKIDNFKNNINFDGHHYNIKDDSPSSFEIFLVSIAKIENLKKYTDIKNKLNELIEFYRDIKDNSHSIKTEIKKNSSDFENLLKEQVKKLGNINNHIKNKNNSEIIKYLETIENNKNLIFNSNFAKLAGLGTVSGAAAHFGINWVKNYIKN